MQYHTKKCHALNNANSISVDVYIEHKRHYLANDIFAEIFFFSSTQNVLNIGTVKHAPT